MDLLILDISCTYAHALRLSASGFSHWMSCVQSLRDCLCQSVGLSLAGLCPTLGTTYSSLKEIVVTMHPAAMSICVQVLYGRMFLFLPSGGSGPMVAHCVSHRTCALSDLHKSVNSRNHLLLLRMRAGGECIVPGRIPTPQREQGTGLSCERLYPIPPEVPEPPLSHLHGLCSSP